MRVSDIATAANRFKNRAAAAQPEYAAGVRAAGAEWATNTAGAADNYNQGVQAAIGRNAFARGVEKAGSAKYVDRASGPGAARFAEGVGRADQAWAAGSRPYLDLLKSLTLPPKSMKGSPNNMLRVNAVTTALRALKTGQATT